MASLTTQMSNLQFITAFISYAFWPTQTQKEKDHLKAITTALGWIFEDIIIHLTIHLICSYFIARCNIIISITLLILLYSYHFIDLVANLFMMRDKICFDLRRYISKNTTFDTKVQYLDLYYSLTQYKTYIRYYRYNQDKQMECSICKDPFDNINYNNQYLIVCGHKFHKHCLKRYNKRLKRLGQRLKCAVCKQSYCRLQHTYQFEPNFYRENIIYTQIPSYIKKPHIKINKCRDNIEKYVLSSLPFYSL